MIDLTKSPDKIRASILQAAMSGQLTQQLPEDGTAEDLIKEIDNEKKRLIEDGKIKKQKALPDIEDDEIPFEIPSNWKWVRLGNIAQLIIGKTPSRHNPEYWNGNIPWVSVRDLNNGLLSTTKEGITVKASEDKFNKNIVPAGTMLMSFKLSIGKVAILDMPAYHNEAIASFNYYKDDESLKKFIFKTISFLTKFADSKNAIQGKTLNKTSLNNMMIPLPPLAEQQRIVDKLDELLPKVSELKENTDKLEQLRKDFPNKIRQSLLQAAMKGDLTNQLPEDGSAEDLLKEIDDEKKRLIEEGKIKKQKALPDIEDDEIPFDIPSNWRWVRLQNICDVKDGTHDSPSYIEKGVPLVTSKNIKNGKIDFSNCKFISKEDSEKINKRSNVDVEDILMPMIGTIGNPAICDDDRLFSIKNVALIKNNKFLLNTFVFNWISLFQETLKKNSSGAVQSFVSLTKLRQMLIPLPPLSEQKRIVKKLDKLFSKLDN
ncbi:restriction endonuclease subunit S [Lactobacillus sp. M0345]|nr:restriction endonuclease subunit S [Lactobacillus sp. M0345]